VHSQVLEMEPGLKRGASVILQQVSVLSPVPSMHYLCITENNIVQVGPGPRGVLWQAIGDEARRGWAGASVGPAAWRC
jgi:hypothetical protein